MYTHEFVRSDGHDIVRHNRDTKTRTGLFVRRELGFTVARAAQRPVPEGLIIPDPTPIDLDADVLLQRVSSAPVIREVPCTSLSEFVARGTDTWRQIIGGSVGRVTSLGICLTTVPVRAVETPHPSGLVLAHEANDLFEQRLVAEAAEQNAIETIVSNVVTDGYEPGGYL